MKLVCQKNIYKYVEDYIESIENRLEILLVDNINNYNFDPNITYFLRSKTSSSTSK